MSDVKPQYTNTLNRKQVSTLFKARTRMMDVKGNYTNKYKDTRCRLCKKADETQKHILEECRIIEDNNIVIKKCELFTSNTIILIDVCNRLEKINDLIINHN